MIKKKDILIFAHLRQNARMALTELSRKTSLPVSTIFDRLRSNKDDVIKKQVALLDFSRLGFNSKAHIKFKANKKDKEKLREFLMKNLNVNSLYKINNGFDFSAECIFRNLQELEDFLEHIDENFSIKTKEVCYILDDLKQESFLSEPELVDMFFAEAAM